MGRLGRLSVVPFLYYMTIHNSFTSALVTLVPVQLKFSDVSFQYPETWFRRLTSAVPRREYALQNISLVMDQELVLWTGHSDSGKTTLFQLICGNKTPTSGSFVLSPKHDQQTEIHLPKPIYLELSPDRSDGRVTTQEILESKMESLSSLAKLGILKSDLITHFCGILDYSETSLRQKRDQLSASDNFKLEIFLACLESVAGDDPDVKQLKKASSDSGVCQLPAPVLLLDEWLDKETTAVVHRVQDSLCTLAKAGAIVCVVTHKPERWKLNQVRRVQLHRGSIYMDTPLAEPHIPT